MDPDETPPRHPHPVAEVRLDKWLWAARFFRTRSLAKQAIEAGKVKYNGARSKVSKDVEIGAWLTIRQGWDEVEVVVRELSDQRGGAPAARLLYTETEASRERRTRESELRRAANLLLSPDRPTKKQRRMIHRFKRSLSE
jgi:ribosome-associated heat shock protein Hsp15